MIEMELKLLVCCFKITQWLGDLPSDPIHIHLIFSVYIGVATGGIRGPPPIEMLLMIKKVTKTIVSSVLVFLASLHTTVHAYISN